MGSVLRTKNRATSFAELQSMAAAGQPWAVDALADEFLAPLVSFAEGRGAVDPGGIAHVSLLTVLNRLGELHFEAREQMWAYLCRTARSRIIDEFRATKPVELMEDHQALTTLGVRSRGPNLAPFDERVVERDYVDRLLSPLTSDQRQVLEMRFIDDLSIEETASRTGRSQEAVKGLQRRAINAIVAAVAVILVVVTVRWAGADQESKRTSNAPADTGPELVEQVPGLRVRQGENQQAEDQQGSAVVQVGDGDGEANAGTGDQTDGVVGVAGEADTGRGAAMDAPGQGIEQPDQGAVAIAASRVNVTVGSGRATPLDVSGEPVPIPAHGTRVYCAVSHVAYGDPIEGVGGPEAAVANLYWGNTAADATSTPDGLGRTGNGTCEGGTNDRSAYWMPALFDQADQMVLPEMVLVEYKTFGPPGFDRTSVQPIPADLRLVVDAAVTESLGRVRAAGGGGTTTSFALVFPECVQTDSAGLPVLGSQDGTSHLAYAGAGTATGCPNSHPYRIPQVTYKLNYRVPFDSGWYLSSGYRSGDPAEALTAGFIAGWDPVSMNSMITCTIESLDHCEFVGVSDGRRLSRSQLPERFVGPDGNRLYTDSVTLADGTDRTPFGTAISPTLR